MKEITYRMPTSSSVPAPLRGVTLEGGREIKMADGRQAVKFSTLVEGRDVILVVDEATKPGLEAAIAEAKASAAVDSAKVAQLQKELVDLRGLMNFLGDSELTDDYGRPTSYYKGLLAQEKALIKAIRAAGGAA